MTRTRLLAAAVLIACGCRESPVGPAYSVGGVSPTPLGPTVITGTVLVDGSVSPAAVSLQLESGMLVTLVGYEAQRLGILDGAEVELRGAWTVTDSPLLDTDVSLDPVKPTFSVDRFQVKVV